MSARVTSSEVQQLLAPYADKVDVALFIEQANLIVDEDLVGKGLSDNRLRAIELNLAAHFAVLTVERGGFVFQGLGGSQESYAGNTRDQVRLGSTRFGQQALALDSTGTLSRMASPKGTAEFQVIEVKRERGCWQ